MNEYKDKKKILICITNGWAVRNFVHTGIVNNLNKNYEVSICTTPRLYEFFLDLKDKKSINGVFLIQDNENYFWKRLRQLKKLILQSNFQVSTAILKSQYSMPFNFMSPMIKIFWQLLGLFSSNKFIYLIERFEKAYRSRSLTADEKLFDLLVLGEPFDPRELQMQRSFDKESIKTISIVQSWDNTSTKGRILSCASKILVWGDYQKDEVIKFYPEFDKDNVIPVGLPQFEIYKRNTEKNYFEKRKFFLENLSISYRKKIILFATGAEKIGGLNEPKICEFIAEELNNRLKNLNCHLLIRLHPADKSIRYKNLIDNASVTICEASIPSNQILQDWLPPQEELSKLMNFLKYSDVSINTASTMTLDSMAMNTPVVNIGFDMLETHNRLSCKRFYKYHHWLPLIESDALNIATSPEDLIEMIAVSINRPSSKRKEINHVLNKVCNINGPGAISEIEKIIKNEIPYE